MSAAERLRDVFVAVFGVNPDAVTAQTTPETIEEWDSVNHIQLVMAVEAEFGIEFDPGEIADLTSFDAIRSRIEVGAVDE